MKMLDLDKKDDENKYEIDKRWDRLVAWLGMPALLAAVFWLVCLILLMLTSLGLFDTSWYVKLYMMLTVVMSVVEFVMYALDKRAAVRGRERVPEKRLLIIAAVCGWPGALIGARILRHKTVKPSFRRKMMVVIAAHVGLILLVLAGSLDGK